MKLHGPMAGLTKLGKIWEKTVEACLRMDDRCGKIPFQPDNGIIPQNWPRTYLGEQTDSLHVFQLLTFSPKCSKLGRGSQVSLRHLCACVSRLDHTHSSEAGIFAVGFFAVGNFAVGFFAVWIFRRMEFSPSGFFAVRKFSRTEFAPYVGFTVRNFCRTEFSPYCLIWGAYGVFKLRKTKFFISKTISSIYGSMRKLNFLWIQERPCLHSVQCALHVYGT